MNLHFLQNWKKLDSERSPVISHQKIKYVFLMLSMLSTEQTKRRSGEMRWWGEVHISQLRIRTPVASYYTGHGPAVTGIFSSCFDNDFPCDTYMHEIHLFCSEPMRLFTVVFFKLVQLNAECHARLYVCQIRCMEGYPWLLHGQLVN